MTHKILLIDFEASGHHIDLYWRTLEHSCTNYEIKKLIPKKFKNKIKTPLKNDVVFFDTQQNLMQKIEEIATANDHLILFISADYIQLSLALKLLKYSKYKIRFLYIKSLSVRIFQFKAILKCVQRYILSSIFLHGNDRKIAYIEKDAVKFWSRFLDVRRLCYIPDLYIEPKFIQTEDKVTDSYILVIGAITNRKNIELLIDSLEQAQLKLKVKIRGKIDEEIMEFLQKKRKVNKFVKLDFRDEFISREQYYRYIRNAEIIWLCYTGYDVGSSGVLLDSIFFKKPILATRFGYMGSLLSDGANIQLFSSLELIPRTELIQDWSRLIVDDHFRKKLLSDHSSTEIKKKLSEFFC
jgi:glycosyltransferase involved in cell wall biosynthesis